MLALSALGNGRAYVATALVAEIATDLWLSGFGPFVSAGIGVGNTLEALAGAYLVRRFCGTPFRFEGLRDVLGLVLFAVILSPILSATVGSAVLAAQDAVAFARVWPLWWIGDAVGVLIVAPLVIVVLRRAAAWRDVHWGEAAALLVALLIVSHYVYMSDLPIAYVTLLPLLGPRCASVFPAPRWRCRC